VERVKVIIINKGVVRSMIEKIRLCRDRGQQAISGL